MTINTIFKEVMYRIYLGRHKLSALITSNSARVFLMCWLVPTYQMFQVLFIDRNSHLAPRGPTPAASTITDLDGAVRLGYLMKAMRFPWSNITNVSAPTGTNIWNLQIVLQGIQTISVWFLTRLVSPMTATNLLVLIGWVLTGFCVYKICKEFQLADGLAVAAAIMVQLLPFAEINASNYLSYVFICVPLYVVLTLLRFSRELNKRGLLNVFLAVGISAFFDPYWLFFSLYIVALFAILNLKTLIHSVLQLSRRKVAYAGFSTAILIWLLKIKFVDPILLANSGRKVEVASAGWVEGGLLHLEDWAVSPSTRIGYPLLTLALLSIFMMLSQERFKQYRQYLVVTIAVTMLSTTVDVPFSSENLSIAVWVRHLMPGVRFFARAGFIAAPLIIVLAVCFISEISKRAHKRWTYNFAVCFMLIVAIFPIIPKERLNVSTSYADWKQIRSQVHQVSEPIVLALPFDRLGRDWIEQASMQFPLVNDFGEQIMNPQIEMAASQGAGPFAKYLATHGVTHVLKVENHVSKFVEYELKPPYFSQIGEIALSGFGETSALRTVLYLVKSFPNDHFCTNCFGPFLTSDQRVEPIIGDLVYPPDTSADGTRNWWVGGPQTELTLRYTSLNNFTGAVTSKLKISIAPCLTDLTIQINDGKSSREVLLNTKDPVLPLTFRLNPNQSRRIKIVTEASRCTVSGDPRQLLFQVSDPVYSPEP